nr:MAG TPA: hypothetical protein [Caudoviricetes sp.]
MQGANNSPYFGRNLHPLSGETLQVVLSNRIFITTSFLIC